MHDKAPLFSALTDSGEQFVLSDYVGKTNVILYFYPKDFTMGCTKESCAFRDNWKEVKSLGAVVFGISSDSVESHKAFRSEHSLPFTLLSDENQSVRKLYGVKGRLIPSRVTFVMDKTGTIRDIFSSQLNMSKHVENAIRVLQEIRGEENALATTGSKPSTKQEF